MKMEDIRAVKSKEEIATKLADLGRENLNLRFQKAHGQLENTARMRQVRRDIARLLTRLQHMGET